MDEVAAHLGTAREICYFRTAPASPGCAEAGEVWGTVCTGSAVEIGTKNQREFARKRITVIESRTTSPLRTTVPGLAPHEPYTSRLSARSALYTDLHLLLDGAEEALPSPGYRELVVEDNRLARWSDYRDAFERAFVIYRDAYLAQYEDARVAAPLRSSRSFAKLESRCRMRRATSVDCTRAAATRCSRSMRRGSSISPRTSGPRR